MAVVLEWAGTDEEPVPSSFPSSQHRVRVRGRRTPARPGELPAELEAVIWRGDQLGSPVTSVLRTGFPALGCRAAGRWVALPQPERNPTAPAHPVQTEAHLHAQWRCRRLVLGRRRPAQEDRPVAGLRADLQAPDLLWPCLG